MYSVNKFFRKPLAYKSKIIFFIVFFSILGIFIFREQVRATATSAALLLYKNSDKIWAHKVNSIGKLRTTAGVFSGVEIDLIFVNDNESPHFDVAHSSDESIGLSLDELIEGSGVRASEIGFWLDIKNLNKVNISSLLSRLDHLIKKYSIGSNLLIFESTRYELLTNINDERILKAYYLLPINVNEMSEDQRRLMGLKLAKNAKYANVGAISLDNSMLEFVNNYILPHLEGVMVLTWYPTDEVIEFFSGVKLQQEINKKDVRVVLVSFPSVFNR